MRGVVARAALTLGVLLSLMVPAGMSPAAAAGSPFTDVPTSYWDYTAIVYVASTHTWMQDFGPDTFQPSTKETRSLLASALVKAYAPNEPIDPTITFPDLPDTDPFYRYANVAVKLGWIPKQNDGEWGGNNKVKKIAFDKAIILAMGLGDAADGIAHIHQSDGTTFTFDDDRIPHMSLAAWLGLHYNWDGSNESKDLQSTTYIPRDEVAYSIWTAKNTPSWKLADAAMFDDVEIGDASNNATNMTRYALNQIGFPYIYAGEWNAKSPAGYCCGSQPQGGFDCSGFVWWVSKKNEDGYNAAQFHPDYKGWVLHERSSSQMAQMTTTKLTWSQLVPGNLMFQASNGGSRWQDVDHVSIWLGNGWIIHSTDGGPQLEWAGDGWYKDNFVFGRKLTLNETTSPMTVRGLTGGDPVVLDR
jgi:cell wall-associated NlpC family hydrolase